VPVPAIPSDDQEKVMFNSAPLHASSRVPR
jgi:hypothetical protein